MHQFVILIVGDFGDVNLFGDLQLIVFLHLVQ